jgi:hypothetical protein
MTVTRVAKIRVAAEEQCKLRGGTEITLEDFARGLAVVVPELIPGSADVQIIDADLPSATVPMTIDAHRFYGSLFTGENADDSLIPGAIATLDPGVFSFHQVQTTGKWRTTNAVVQHLQPGEVRVSVTRDQGE